MGVALEVWRQRIGCYRPSPSKLVRVEPVFASPGTQLGLGSRTFLFVILTCALSCLLFTIRFDNITLAGDVEINPGPTPLLSEDLLESLKNGTCNEVSLAHPVCNKHIMQLIATREGQPTTKWEDAMKWIHFILPDIPSGETKWPRNLRDSWNKIRTSHRDLKKSVGRPAGKERLHTWEEQIYQLPKIKGPRNTPPCTPSPCTPSPSIFDTQVYDATTSKLTEMCDKLKHENYELKQENDELKLKIEGLKLRPSPHSQKVNSRREIDHWEKIYGQRERLNTLEKKSDKLEARLQNEKKIKRQLEKEFEKSAKVAKLDEDTNREWTQTYVASLEEENNTLRNKVEQHEETINQLSNDLKEANKELKQVKGKSISISLFNKEKNRYFPFVHKCVWNLVGKHVSYANVCHVIRIILEMVNVTYDRLPSESTIRNMNNERTLVSQIQIAEIADRENTTLGTDETPKNADIFMTYTVTGQDGEAYLLGLRQMASKSAQHTLDTLQETLSDISDICDKANAGTNVGHKVLCQIRNTMSDRAATEVLFNEMLKSYRKTCLPLYQENWNQFSDVAREKLSEMYNFFCGLHLLTSMADAVAASFKKIEDTHLDSNKAGAAAEAGIQVFNTGSGTIRLVQNSCKALARGADEKNGCFRAWKTYKNRSGMTRKTYLLPFRGNRFNVVFLFGGRIYFLANKITDFIQNVHGAANGLLKAVLADVKVPLYLAGCKVLGIINKTISTPLWRQTENKGHILELCQTYTGLVTFLERVTQDEENLADFAYGRISYFEEALIEKDELYTSLTSPGPHDDIALSFLQHTLLTLLQLFKRVTKDYLPGGKFHLVKDNIDVRDATASAPKHNKLPERIFGYLDYLVHKRPNSSAIANEAQVLYTFNKTASFVDDKSEEELADLVKTVQMESRNVMLRAKERNERIASHWEQKQAAKAEALEKSRKRALAKKENLTNDIMDTGLWQSEHQMEEGLSRIKAVNKQVDALKRQIRFRREVLQQYMDGDKGFTFSNAVPGTKRRVDKPPADLKCHLLKMINAAKSVTESQSVQKTPDNEFLTIPLLVGKKVSHQWNTEDVQEWYTGKVISQVPGFPSWYNIIYDNDPKVYSLRLVEDYKDNTLILLV